MLGSRFSLLSSPLTIATSRPWYHMVAEEFFCRGNHPVQFFQFYYPSSHLVGQSTLLLYTIFDYLAIQGSAVLCDHVFLSVKETIMMCCNQMGCDLMEALQICYRCLNLLCAITIFWIFYWAYKVRGNSWVKATSRWHIYCSKQFIFQLLEVDEIQCWITKLRW